MPQKRDVWDKVKELPFADEVIEDLMSEVVMPVLKDTAHATHIAEGRRELAINILSRLGAL